MALCDDKPSQVAKSKVKNQEAKRKLSERLQSSRLAILSELAYKPCSSKSLWLESLVEQIHNQRPHLWSTKLAPMGNGSFV